MCDYVWRQVRACVQTASRLRRVFARSAFAVRRVADRAVERFYYPGIIRDGLARLGWAGLAGWAGCERLGLLGWLGVLAGCWLDFDEKG